MHHSFLITPIPCVPIAHARRRATKMGEPRPVKNNSNVGWVSVGWVNVGWVNVGRLVGLTT